MGQNQARPGAYPAYGPCGQQQWVNISIPIPVQQCQIPVPVPIQVPVPVPVPVYVPCQPRPRCQTICHTTRTCFYYY